MSSLIFASARLAHSCPTGMYPAKAAGTLPPNISASLPLAPPWRASRALCKQALMRPRACCKMRQGRVTAPTEMG